MSVAFYRKYRSKKLSEVVGQKHITDVLDLALKQEKIAHAYLFTGPRGVGKTSIARILAHEINNLPYNEESEHPDIIEIDAASNNGVDDIRQLREQVQVAPFSAKFRVYIIDEVHMLSKSAFNALLKTLEEPPEHAVFILATTDAHKLPATIISRTQQFVFRFILKEDVCEHLNFIAKNEKIKISKDALEIIAERGEGSFRDSISLLDQISSLNSGEEITAKMLEEILGLAPKNQISKIIHAYETQNAEAVVGLISEIRNSGVDLKIFTSQIIAFIKENLGKKPQLSRLISPLVRAEKSDFIELELLSIFIDDSFAPKFSNVEILPAEPTLQVQPAKIKSKPKAEQPAELKTEKPPKAEVLKEKKEIPKEEFLPEPEEIPQNETLITAGEAVDFRWESLVDAIEEGDKGIQTLLRQSGYIKEDGVIKVYAGNPFSKKQLDKAKARAVIGEALSKIGAGGWIIETYGKAKPADDPEAAEIQKIMGGGEMVSVDE